MLQVRFHGEFLTGWLEDNHPTDLCGSDNQLFSLNFLAISSLPSFVEFYLRNAYPKQSSDRHKDIYMEISRFLSRNLLCFSCFTRHSSYFSLPTWVSLSLPEMTCSVAIYLLWATISKGSQTKSQGGHRVHLICSSSVLGHKSA